MNSKRQDYRHVFAALEQRPVEMVAGAASGPVMRGAIVNLSIGGAGIRLHDDAARPSLHGRVSLRFALLPEQLLAVPAEVIHGTEVATTVCGVRFLPLAEPAATANRSRLLAKFLIDEQRRTRRKSA